MAWFTQNSARTPAWTHAEAQMMLLLCAMFCDGRTPVEERVEARALRQRTATLHETAPEAAEAMLQRFLNRLNTDSVDGIMRKACAALEGEGAALSIYAHCRDLIHADREINAKEKAFLQAMARALKIAPGKRALIDRVLALKNQA